MTTLSLPHGLSESEVAERVQAGKINSCVQNGTRSCKEIFASNIFTFFNLINVILLVLVCSVGSYKNGLFFFIIILNTAVGIVQEIRTKRTLDKLRIMNASHVDTVRGGKIQRLTVDALVPDDCILLKAGAQIPADAAVLSGQLEVDESLLTGESVSVEKAPGDNVLSGSYVTAGEAVCRVVHVGADNYSAQLTKEARTYRKHPSALRDSLDKILKVIGVLIVPVGVLLFAKEYFLTQAPLRDSVVHTVAAVLGMIPEGLVLLTSVALTLGVLHLAKQKTLVQELYCIETLARIDVLCLDKTGTLTEGRMTLEKSIPLHGAEIEPIMQRLMAVLPDESATLAALAGAFPPAADTVAQQIIPFSSARKYSGAVFNDGTYLLGAVQFLFPQEEAEIRQMCAAYAAESYRLLVLAHSRHVPQGSSLPEELQPMGILLLRDVIRPDAAETLRYFAQQGVTLKIISGDDPVTVAAVAERAGLAGASSACVDATTLQTSQALAEAVQHYTVFGRVTPQQKKAMVLALKEQGHSVAMTGDGVNDVPALKQADCSIAMASGSDAAKSCANLVLLHSNFSAMPHIVNEGRRVTNNIRMAASMFLIKTIFSAVLAVLAIFVGKGYPFEPIQMSLIGACATGIPTFFLQLEPNFTLVAKGFLRRVLAAAVPPALAVVTCVLLAMLADSVFGFAAGGLAAVCTVVTGCIYTSALYRVYSPLSRYRVGIIAAAQALFCLCLLLGHRLFNIAVPQLPAALTAAALCCFSFGLVWLYTAINRMLHHSVYHL